MELRELWRSERAKPVATTPSPFCVSVADFGRRHFQQHHHNHHHHYEDIRDEGNHNEDDVDDDMEEPFAETVHISGRKASETFPRSSYVVLPNSSASLVEDPPIQRRFFHNNDNNQIEIDSSRVPLANDSAALTATAEEVDGGGVELRRRGDSFGRWPSESDSRALSGDAAHDLAAAIRDCGVLGRREADRFRFLGEWLSIMDIAFAILPAVAFVNYCVLELCCRRIAMRWLTDDVGDDGEAAAIERRRWWWWPTALPSTCQDAPFWCIIGVHFAALVGLIQKSERLLLIFIVVHAFAIAFTLGYLAHAFYAQVAAYGECHSSAGAACLPTNNDAEPSLVVVLSIFVLPSALAWSHFRKCYTLCGRLTKS